MSFPVVEQSVLQNNPDFALLHGKLTNVLLNPDGSTKEDAGARQRRQIKDVRLPKRNTPRVSSLQRKRANPIGARRADAWNRSPPQELDRRRLKAAKQHILARAIATATSEQQQQNQNQPTRGRFTGRAQQRQSGAGDVPEPLMDLVLLLPALVGGQTHPQPPVSADAAALLMSSEPLASIDALLPDLAALLTSHLRSSALSLARIANPSTNPSYLHRHISSLAQSHAALCESATAAHASLVSARLRSLASLVDLLSCYAAGLTALIRSLEVKHGVVARSVDLRASKASLAAMHARTAAESALHACRSQLYTPRACNALSTYAAHLRDARVRAGERVKGLSTELAGYGVGVQGGASKERTMREMARVYRDMTRQMDDAKADLERLHQS